MVCDGFVGSPEGTGDCSGGNEDEGRGDGIGSEGEGSGDGSGREGEGIGDGSGSEGEGIIDGRGSEGEGTIDGSGTEGDGIGGTANEEAGDGLTLRAAVVAASVSNATRQLAGITIRDTPSANLVSLKEQRRSRGHYLFTNLKKARIPRR
jgi:hypothetical protein